MIDYHRAIYYPRCSDCAAVVAHGHLCAACHREAQLDAGRIPASGPVPTLRNRNQPVTRGIMENRLRDTTSVVFIYEAPREELTMTERSSTQRHCRRCGAEFTPSPRQRSGGTPQTLCPGECQRLANVEAQQRRRASRRAARSEAEAARMVAAVLDGLAAADTRR